MNLYRTSLSALALSFTLFACSFINSPEDLIEWEDDIGSGGNMGGGPAANGNNTGGAPSGGNDNTGGAPGQPAPTSGLIVLAAQNKTLTERFLTVLDAQDGSELLREKLPAVSLAYDGAPGRFAWFIFTSSAISPEANTRAELQVRRYDDQDTQWLTLSKTASLPPPVLKSTQGAAPRTEDSGLFRPAVLNHRLAYISQTINNGIAEQSLTILNTSDLADVSLISSERIPVNETILGLVGRRGTELDAGSVGGSLSVLVGRPCLDDPAKRCIVARPFTVSKGGIDELQADSLGTYEGVPAFASTPVLPPEVMRPFPNVIKSLGAYAIFYDPTSTSAQWLQFDPADPRRSQNASSLPNSNSKVFYNFAVSECLAAGVVSSLTLDAIHLANGNVLGIDTQSSSVISIEPFQTNLLTMDSTLVADKVVKAFQIETIGGITDKKITLAPRSNWQSPTDLVGVFIAQRTVDQAPCK